MIKTYKAFLIGLALLPLTALAQTNPAQIQETYPPAGTTLSSNEPVYVRLSYQSDKPLRLQAAGFLNGSKVEAATANPAPVYPAGSGEAIAWVAYNGKVNINELQIIVYDENWETLHSVHLPVEMQWSGRPSRNWRQPAPWVQTLNAQLQTMAGSSTEQPPAATGATGSEAGIAAGDGEGSKAASLLIWILPLLALAIIGALIAWSTKKNSK